MPATQRHIASEPRPSSPLTARVRSTFIAPFRLVGLLRGSAPWLDVLLLSTAIAAISVLAMPDEFFLEPMREAVSRRGDPVEITSSPDQIALWGRAIGILATIATHPILIFTLAGLLTLVFSVLDQGRTGFSEYLSLAAHGMLIPALGSVMVFVTRIVVEGIDSGIMESIQRRDRRLLSSWPLCRRSILSRSG